MDPMMPPTAPVSMNTPNHASGNRSGPSRNSTNVAVANDEGQPAHGADQPSVTSIRLLTMNR